MACIPGVPNATEYRAVRVDRQPLRCSPMRPISLRRPGQRC